MPWFNFRLISIDPTKFFEEKKGKEKKKKKYIQLYLTIISLLYVENKAQKSTCIVQKSSPLRNS